MAAADVISRLIYATCMVHFILLTSQAATADGAKILLTPININSHVLYFRRLAVELAKLGHSTRLIVPTNSRAASQVAIETNINFTCTAYPTDGNVSFSNSPEAATLLLNMALSKSPFEKFTILSEFGEKLNQQSETDCDRLLENVDLMRELRHGGYQFAIMDPMAALHCYYILPYSMEIHYASLSLPWTTWLYRVPRLPSFASFMSVSDRMTFSERMTCLLLEATEQAIYGSLTSNYTKYAPDKEPLNLVQLLQRASLWFFLEDIAVNYALPQMPNTVAIGDIMAGSSGQPLPADLERFVAGSKAGVIIVSFGSFFNFIPKYVGDKFCDAFRNVPNGFRIIWKTKREFCKNIKHVKVLPWIPQNDLLFHAKSRFFISHGGLNSIVESVYHAKPLIIFPIALDQPANAAAAERKGYAIRMDLADFTSEELLANINKIVNDPTYQRKVELASAILRDHQESPAQRVSDMIEHVLKYGDQHLRTGAFELSHLQFMMFDIFAAILSAVVLLVAVLVLICYCVWRKCLRRCCNNKKEKSKGD